jgi:hypothetical protein
MGGTPIETYEMLQSICGDEALIRINVFKWFKRIEDGREDLQDDPRSGRPSTSRNADTIANAREIMTRDRRGALRMMADELNISKETTRQILHEDLQKRKMCAKFVPHRLTDQQKKWRLASWQEFAQTCQDKPSCLV